MFDFVSPFDSLALSPAAPVRKPAQPSSHQQGPSELFEDTWTSVIDPKRKSVDNLLEQIGHTKASVPSVQPISFDQHSPDDETPISELVQSKAASCPLTPKPTQAPSPLGSPRSFAHAYGCNSARQGKFARSARELEGTRRWSQARSRGSGSKVKAPSGPNSQPHTIVVDVAQSLDDIQAPCDAVKSTAV